MIRCTRVALGALKAIAWGRLCPYWLNDLSFNVVRIAECDEAPSLFDRLSPFSTYPVSMFRSYISEDALEEPMEGPLSVTSFYIKFKEVMQQAIPDAEITEGCSLTLEGDSLKLLRSSSFPPFWLCNMPAMEPGQAQLDLVARLGDMGSFQRRDIMIMVFGMIWHGQCD